MRRRDHFGLIARFYDRIFGGRVSPRLGELLALPAGRLLDVGGGTGRVASNFADQLEQIVLCDISLGMLGESRGRPKIRRVRGRAEFLPFADGAFDRVLVVDAFHHFGDHQLAAQELMRVVAPGGRLIVQDMNVEEWPVKLVALGEKALLMGSRFYRPAGLYRLFEGTGRRVTSEAEGPTDFFVMVDKEP